MEVNNKKSTEENKMKNSYKILILILGTLTTLISMFLISKHTIYKEQKKTFSKPAFLVNKTFLLNEDKSLTAKDSYQQKDINDLKKITVDYKFLNPSPERAILLERIFDIPKDLFDEYEIHYKEDNYFVFTPKSSQTPPFSIITDNKTENIKTMQKKIKLIVADII